MKLWRVQGHGSGTAKLMVRKSAPHHCLNRSTIAMKTYCHFLPIYINISMSLTKPVGAVHGAIGIITQIVLTDPTWAAKLEAELGTLLTYQYEEGNWPSSIPPGRDRLVQVCHGGPGIVISLLSIRSHFPKLQSRIDRCIEKGRAAIKERGLLTKEPCLCHGISGNALALEQDDFEHFLSFTTGHEMKAMEKDGMMEKSDDPSGLWTGEAGRAWAWAVAEKGLDKTLLGYNDV